MNTRRSKAYREKKKTIPETTVEVSHALEVIKGWSALDFDESVDVAINLGINVKASDQNVRGSVVLPHGTGRNVRVLVFAQGEQAQAAQDAGADYVGDEELIEKIKGGWLAFEKVIATPNLMGKVSQVAKILGPKGLMPNPKLGTVTMDVAAAVKNQKKGTVEYRSDKGGVVHAPIGKRSFSAVALAENYEVLLGAVGRSKPATVKGDYIRSIYLSSTMGPSIAIKKQGE